MGFGTRLDYETLKSSSSGTALKGKKANQIIAALYGEDEYFITDDLIFTLGLRYIYGDLFSSEFTPRAYLVYHINDNIALRGGVAKGYKTPAAKQLSDRYYSLSATTASFGNPELKPEKSINYELGVNFNILDLRIILLRALSQILTIKSALKI